jgi:hypothetical protein
MDAAAGMSVIGDAATGANVSRANFGKPTRGGGGDGEPGGGDGGGGGGGGGGGKPLDSGNIYRGGGGNPGNLKRREGEDAVSFRDSLSNHVDSKANPTFKPGGQYVEVDVAKLPKGSATADGRPHGPREEGHVSVTATPEEIKAAIVPQVKPDGKTSQTGKLPELTDE